MKGYKENHQPILLQGETSVILEICIPTLWVSEPVDDIHDGSDIRKRLLDFGFGVLSYMQVVTNGSCCVDQFLQFQCTQ